MLLKSLIIILGPIIETNPLVPTSDSTRIIEMSIRATPFLIVNMKRYNELEVHNKSNYND